MKFDAIEAAVTAAVAAAGLAAITPNAETKILAFSIIGSALGGLVALGANGDGTLTAQQKRWRWITNFSGGIFTGPLTADYAIHHWLPEANTTYTALAAGGLCGWASVAVFCLAGPIALTWLKSKFTPPSKLP